MPESPQEKLRPPPEPPLAERFAPAELEYSELDVTTNFSFLRGASHADELVLTAARLGYRAIAVTDLNTLAGAVRMFDAARQISKTGWGPKLITGARLAFTDAPDLLVWALRTRIWDCFIKPVSCGEVVRRLNLLLPVLGATTTPP